MAWYKDWFGEDYLKAYPHRDDTEAKAQIDFVVKILSLPAGARVLDVGCGRGRHAIALCRMGYRVTCLDLSPVLLRLAKQKSEQVCCARFVQADMRRIPFAAVFDAVMSLFTTFGYFKTDEQNQQTLVSIGTALKPGGWFFLDYLNKDFVVKNFVARDCRADEGFEISQERTYNQKDQRIEKKIRMKENGRLREYSESVRLYTLNEMQAMLAAAGLRLMNTFGDFDGSDFSAGSPRLILVGKREAD
jgi:SAM-dependent methyltransferase